MFFTPAVAAFLELTLPGLFELCLQGLRQGAAVFKQPLISMQPSIIHPTQRNWLMKIAQFL